LYPGYSVDTGPTGITNDPPNVPPKSISYFNPGDVLGVSVLPLAFKPPPLFVNIPAELLPFQ